MCPCALREQQQEKQVAHLGTVPTRQPRRPQLLHGRALSRRNVFGGVKTTTRQSADCERLHHQKPDVRVESGSKVAVQVDTVALDTVP